MYQQSFKKQKTEHSNTFTSFSKLKQDCSMEDVSVYSIKILGQIGMILKHEHICFGVFYEDFQRPMIKMLRKKSHNTKYLATLFCLQIMRHFTQHVTLKNLRKITNCDVEPRSGLFSTAVPIQNPNPRNVWENILSSKQTFSDLDSSTSVVLRTASNKQSTIFPKAGAIGQVGAIAHSSVVQSQIKLKEFNVFANVNLRIFSRNFMKMFKKVFSNINFDRKKTLMQMFVIDKVSKRELFRHCFISHTSKHIDFIQSEVTPFLVSNIIENIEDYLLRKSDEMNGQKMEFEHYFLNKILKVIYIPSWRGLYIVFLVEAHLGITRYPGHLSRQIDIKRHIEKLRRDRFKCRKTYRVFVGEFRDPMAYEDFIWKYVAQILMTFDPTPDNNLFAPQNIRQHFETSTEHNNVSPSILQSNAKNSLFDLMQHMITPSGNGSVQESFLTMDNRATPGHFARSRSSFDFSDISRIDELNHTPGGFFSIIKNNKKSKYTADERSDYGLESAPKSRVPLKSFEDRTERSLTIYDGGPKHTHRINSPLLYHNTSPPQGRIVQIEPKDPPYMIGCGSSPKVYREAQEYKEDTSTTEALMKEQLLANYVRSQKIERKDLAEETLLSVSQVPGQSEEARVKNDQEFVHDTKEVSVSEVPPMDTALLKATDPQEQFGSD